MKNHENNKIIEEIIKGDQMIIKAFYKNNLPYIRRYIIQNSGNEQDVEDIFQDAMMVIYQKSILGQLEIRSSLQSYFYGVCKNLWRSNLRKKRKLAVHHSILDYQDEESAHSGQNLDIQERQDIFHKYFLKLSASNKELLNLLFEGKSMRQISKITGYTESYSRKKKYETKNYLKKMMEKDPVYQELVSA